MSKPIYPCIWFNNNAQEAAAFYCEIFNKASILESNPIVTRFTAGGIVFMLLNGGPKYKVTPAVSYFVYCNGEGEINRLYEALKEGGNVLMPIGKYDWSPRYAWVQDRFGVNWQLDVEEINNEQKIVPNLLFVNKKNAQVAAARNFYMNTFANSMQLMDMPYPPEAGMGNGTLLFAQFKLNGFIMNAMSSTLQHEYDFTPGNSFVVECDDQKEIDYFWETLGAGGRYDMCGWLADQYGVSWQIVPAVLSELMSNPEKGPRVIQAFLKMQKFDIQTLLDA
ncbi:VOC family protein [Sediminibacterium sp.]|uniref:VOC family protein n=1 Tax=Sediminibacterium sp. TaxID=1917865 RepID=UPI0025DDD470|nr:VOC family protein [Sediminibacterium sp.]MBW0179283.1 VOC family protein [Sediminibacterium sp.]